MVANEVSPVRAAFNEIVENLRRHPVAEFVDHELEI